MSEVGAPSKQWDRDGRPLYLDIDGSQGVMCAQSIWSLILRYTSTVEKPP